LNILDDDTRVHLQRGPNDYINANFVEVPLANRNYILTQVNLLIYFFFNNFFLIKGPLQTTSGHFWQMVWEQNSRVIIMLTHLMEKGCVSN